MARVLINDTYGGFNISEAAAFRLMQLGMDVEVEYAEYGDPYVHLPGDLERHDARLLQVFDKMGQDMAGSCCRLKAVEGWPDDGGSVRYRIVQYDGWERVETPESIDWVRVWK